MNQISEIVPDTCAALSSTALTVIPASAVSTIIAADPNDILGKLAAKVSAHKPDISTNKGRAEIRSLAAEIASSKMDLIRLGKKLTEDARATVKAVNAECNVIEEKMDALKEQVRQPLTDYENRDKERIAAHEAALRDIQALTALPSDCTSEDIRARLAEYEALPVRDWDEFRERASDAMATTLDHLASGIAAAERREAEAAELARLRAAEAERQREEAARQQAEHERRIAAEAAERARLAAEAEAQRVLAEERARAAAERQRVEREAREAQERAAKAERERQEAIDRAAREAREAEERAVRAENERLAAVAKAKADAAALAAKVEADRIAAEQKAEQDRLAAVAAEQKRAADAKAAEEAATRKREANIAHKKRINGEVLSALVLVGATDELSKIIIASIVRGEIPHVSIAY